MPIWTPYRPYVPPSSTVTQPYSAGTVTLNVTFPSPMSSAVYIPTFSIGSGLALPAITISNQTRNGYTATFLALSAGTITANVIGF